jgi:hypothetical protein
LLEIACIEGIGGKKLHPLINPSGVQELLAQIMPNMVLERFSQHNTLVYEILTRGPIS